MNLGKLIEKVRAAWVAVNATKATGPAPTWWTALIAGASAYAMLTWGAPLCQ